VRRTGDSVGILVHRLVVAPLVAGPGCDCRDPGAV